MGVSAEKPLVRPRRSLTLATRMMLLSMGVSGALAFGLTWLGYRKAATGLRAKARLALDSEGLLTTTVVDNWISERLTTLRGVASLRSVRTVLDTAASLAREDVNATNGALADISAVATEIETIDVIDLRGGLVASTTQEQDSGEVAQQAVLQAALGGKEFVSGLSVSPSSGGPCIYTAVPAHGSNGKVVGAVRARESVNRMQTLVTAVHTRMGESAQGVLLDANGLVIAHSGGPELRLRPGPPELGSQKEHPPGAREIDERRVFNWEVSGQTHVTVAAPLQQMGWTYYAALPLAEVERDARDFLRQAVVAALIGLAAAFCLSLLVARRVVHAVKKLIEVSRQIVARNDLSQRLEVTSDDEVGQLTESFARMVDALRDALTTLQSASGAMLEAADQMRVTTESERDFLARQATALQQTQVTAQEIKQTSALASEKANKVLRAAEDASQMGSSGEAVVEQSIGGLAAIQSQTGEIGERIRSLQESAKQIGGITSTVKDLADQSNMLALNAAIEAVRSGEHGKGFAVVAREIRSLADQSIEATRQVGSVLARLGSSIESAVKMAEHGTRAIAEDLSRVRQSGDNLRGMLAIARDNVDSARQIAAAVSQQDTGIQQIFVAVTDQLTMMQETQQRLDRATTASAAVREQAARVTQLLARYLI
jgi:methyl-accepting chemotaxis protein